MGYYIDGMIRYLPLAIIVFALSCCTTISKVSSRAAGTVDSVGCLQHRDCPTATINVDTNSLAEAHRSLKRARKMVSSNIALQQLARCATLAHNVMQEAPVSFNGEASALAARCNDDWLKLALRNKSTRWSQGLTQIGGMEVNVEFRQLSDYFNGPLSLTRAQDVSVALLNGKRHSSNGFGVPLAILAPRCSDRPVCKHIPPEGIFRPATAWLEMDEAPNVSVPRLVISNPLKQSSKRIGNHDYPIAADTSAFFAHGVRRTKLRRLAIWGLLGGDEVGRRSGLYLLEDYDPNKRPIVMIHGLGSSPLAWAQLSNAIWGSPDLRDQFQIWHLVYKTNDPLLITRMQVQRYIDEAWLALDPEGDDPAREGLILIGHSLGGVISRLLCVDSGDVLWSSAFTVPAQQLVGSTTDIETLEKIFKFTPYPGISRAIFIAAPHHGSPKADGWLGRFSKAVIGRRTSEMQIVSKITRENPQAIRDELRQSYLKADINSISTLQTLQPVSKAGQSLMPVVSCPYHTIAGVLPGRAPETDGAVPLSSTLLPGAISTLAVHSGHNVYENDEAIAEVLRILRDDLKQRQDSD